jgi:hypothetical protein
MFKVRVASPRLIPEDSPLTRVFSSVESTQSIAWPSCRRLPSCEGWRPPKPSSRTGGPDF